MKILIVEDDDKTADYVAQGLRQQGHVCERAATGLDGLTRALANSYDVIILDRNLPKLDGLSLLRAMRNEGRNTPVLVLSALGQVDDRVQGLKAGADDYLSKPFSFEELTARLAAIVRRGDVRADREADRLRVADLELDRLSRTAQRNGRRIELSTKEFQILDYLMRHAGQVVTRTMLLEGVWDYHFDPGTNVIDVHISRLRGKIDAVGETPLLHTIRGAGYRLGAR